MVNLNTKITAHPAEYVLADFLAGGLSKDKREQLEKHLSSCDQCLNIIVAAHEAVTAFDKKRPFKKLREITMKKINIYLLLAIISFSFSFITPRFFIQLLVATLLLGMKWVADSKSTRMLVMIYEAWKRDGARGAGDALETLDIDRNKRS
ncbi:MAG: zf-HC2 domain-containing protein [Candidatus Omnitrophica bacterium]|nr:zf-HC2 domain-containing protein [Candidatus Omnitrophota bacterium]